ncbi:MAG: Gmad2 immunoglobulin-like domain-containing protein [Chloroflexota bacterium]
MKRFIGILLCVLVLPSVACNLGEAPPATPTLAPVLNTPIVGLNPISGAPGTVITVVIAGFPTGSSVNLFLSPADAATSTTPIAQNLTIGAGGILSFAFQLPNTVNGTALNSPTSVSLTVSTTDNTVRASALFLANVGNGTPTATPQATNVGNSTSGGSSTSGSNLFITSPSINALVVGNAVVVTGSGSAFNSRVGVQVLNANYQVLGSVLGVIQAGAGAVGPWQVTVGFTQPGAPAVGYIVAYTVNAAGGVATQGSIPVSLAGQAAVTTIPTVAAATSTNGPTVPPVITGGPTAAPPTVGFITATP